MQQAYVQERYRAVQIAANSVTTNPSQHLGGFLCVTAGTITITSTASTPRPLIPTFTVAAGVYYPFPFVGFTDGMVITTAGGASGVLAVA